VLAALAAAPSSARAVTPGTATGRRALAATLAGDGVYDGRHDGRARAARRRCPDPMAETAGGRIALRVEGTLARWGASARRWAEERAAIAVYVADVTGLSELASRLTDPTA
jgi:hypothetical protein